MQNLYRHFDKNNNLLYVGVSINAIYRLSQHKQNAHWFELITKVEIEHIATREQAIEAERKAITDENPLYNLYRPSAKEQNEVIKKNKKADTKKSEISRKNLLNRVVQFNPMYSMQEVGDVLKVSVAQVKKWCDAGVLAHIVVKKKWDERWQKEIVSRKVTGWQLIDFIENLENGLIDT